MEKDFQSRRWQLTINNPEDYGYTADKIIELIILINIIYACFCYEIGADGTPHVHIYIVSHSPIRFSRMKKLFPEAHLEKPSGTHKQNRDYITKSGKWEEDEKKETNLPDTFMEIGELPPDRATADDKKQQLMQMIKAGMTTREILEADSSYVYRINAIETLRQTLVDSKFISENRDVQVTFLTGATGTGKTRSIIDEYGAENVCRITSYRPNGQVYFDSYNGQDVLVFEEFDGQVPITEMLNYLDIYPLKLPARYMDRQACYTKVYITSNLAIDDIYVIDKISNPRRYAAFLRRIKTIKTFSEDGTVTIKTPNKEDKEHEYSDYYEELA